MSAVLTVRGTVVIDVEGCKGCELCIPACPPQVLEMSDDLNSHGYRFPRLLVGCTGCRACREICPDFVFDVFKFAESIVLDAAEAANGTSELEL